MSRMILILSTISGVNLYIQFSTTFQYQNIIKYTYRVIIIHYDLSVPTADDRIGYLYLTKQITASQ